jgi:hypothetical protein
MRRHLAWTITSSDSSQQRAQTFEAGGGRIIARCPFRVKLRSGDAVAESPFDPAGVKRTFCALNQPLTEP